MRPGAHPRLFLGESYPVAREYLYLLLHLSDPEMADGDLKGSETVRAWRKYAAEAERYADMLERLLREGWRVSSVGGLLAAHRTAKTLEETLDLVQRDSVLSRGTPIEICVAGEGTPMLAAGGLLVGMAPHPEIYPPRTIPALVALQPSGDQLVVETPDALREAVSEGIKEITLWLDEEQSLLRELNATDLPDAVRELAAEVKGDGPIPRGVRLDLGQHDMDLDAPTGSVSVTPVSGAVWSAVSSKAGTISTVMLSFPLEGIGAQLRDRGTQIALELLASPRQ